MNRHRVRQMNAVLVDWFKRELNDQRQQSLLLSGIDSFYFPSTTILYTMAFTCVTYEISCPISIIVQHLQHQSPIVYDLGVPQKIPWNITNGGFLFYLEYSHISVVNYTVFLSAAIDVLFAYYTFIISRLFKLLSYKFEKFIFCYENETTLKILIRQHQTLISFRKDLEICYGPVIFALCITCAMTMCTLLYRLYMVK